MWMVPVREEWIKMGCFRDLQAQRCLLTEENEKSKALWRSGLETTDFMTTCNHIQMEAT